MHELDISFGDGRTLHVYDTVLRSDSRLAVMWHHGTPNIGSPPEPLFPAADRLGIRWVSHDRPGYGGSTRNPGRDVGSVANDVETIVDALGIERFAVLGHSGGGPHALACAALLPDRVLAAVSISGLAPFDAGALDWFAGMAPAGIASLRAAAQGRVAKERHEATAGEQDPGFIPADLTALEGEWSWFMEVVGPAIAAGQGGLIDDDLAFVAPWGVDPAQIAVPTLLLHGGQDRIVPSSHGEWLGRSIPTAELHVELDAGHISIMRSAASTLKWLRDVTN